MKKSKLCIKHCQEIEPMSSWVKLFGVVMLHILIVTPEMTYGIFYDHLRERYDSNAADIGWIFFIFYIFFCVTGLFCSPFVQYYGCLGTAMVSSVVAAVGMSLASIAHNLWWFIVFYGILGGCGLGALMLCTNTIVQQCFPHNRGLATGISTLGYSAAAVFTPMLVEMFLQKYSLSGALLLHGAIYVQGIVFAAFMGSPHEFVQSKDKNIKQVFTKMMDFSAFKEPSFVVCVLHKMFIVLSRVGLLTHTVSAAIKQGVNEKSAAYLFIIMGLCNFVTRIMSSVLMNVECIDSLLYNCVGTLFLTVSAIIVTIADRYELFVLSMIFMGSSEGIANTVFNMVVIRILGVENFSRSFSIIILCLLPAPLIGSPFTGWLVDITGHYTVSFVVVGISGFVSTVLAIIMTILVKIRNKREQDAYREDDDAKDIETVHDENTEDVER